MTAQFAGSRSVDDRRRRRLAQEAGGGEEGVAQGGKSVAKVDSSASQSEPATYLVSDIAAEESLVPSALWKVMAFGVLGVSLLCTLAWVNVSELQLDGVERLLSPVFGQAFQFYSAVSLLLASQLSFMIWWYRSRSRKDFGGRYRIWAWAGCFWGVSCVAVGIGVYEPIAALAFERWPIHAWRPELLYWFTPFGIGVLALHQLISLDMRHSKVSRILWNFSLGLGIVAAVLKFGFDLYLPSSVRELSTAVAASLWHFSLPFVLLFHARFVVHVTNEAAPRGVSRLSRVRTWVWRRSRGVRKWCAVMWQSRCEKVSERRALKAEARAQKKLAAAEKREARASAKQLSQEEKAEKKKAMRADAERVREERKLAKLAADEEKKKQSAQKKEEKLKKREEQKSRAVKSQSDGAAASASVDVEESPVVKETRAEKAAVPEPRTVSGKKRKRVLAQATRIDPAHDEVETHAELNEYNDFGDDWGEDEGASRQGRMSKRQKKRARKNRN